MHPEVEAVMNELDGHRVRFESLCRALSDEELGRAVPNSTWLVRDFIAHLATIDGPIAEMFRSVQSGKVNGLRDPDRGAFDIDRWNEERVRERRGRTVADLLREAAELRSELRDCMGRFSEEDLRRKLRFSGDAKRPPGEVELRAYLRGWCKHDPMHAVDMMRALPERMTPVLQQWFDDPIVARYQAAMNPE